MNIRGKKGQVKIRVNLFPSPFKVPKLYLVVETEIISLSGVVLNVCRENIWDNYVGKVKGHNGSKVSMLHSNW